MAIPNRPRVDFNETPVTTTLVPGTHLNPNEVGLNTGITPISRIPAWMLQGFSGPPTGSPDVGRTLVPDFTPIDPANSLRGQQIKPTDSAGLNTLNADLLNRAGTAGRGVREFAPITPTNLNNANAFLQRAGNQQFRDVSPTGIPGVNTAGTRDLLGSAASGRIQGVGASNIAGLDFGGARSAISTAQSELGNIGNIGSGVLRQLRRSLSWFQVVGPDPRQ